MEEKHQPFISDGQTWSLKIGITCTMPQTGVKLTNFIAYRHRLHR